jgi:beta-galactosidase
MTLLFKEGMVNSKEKRENVLLVVQDDTGHDQLSAAVNPRGILNATLLGEGIVGTGFAEWKVAGTAGVDKPDGSLDPLRTRYNEGGLAAERLGWHLPGFDDSGSEWEKGKGPKERFTGAGVRFYRGRLPLDVPEGMDVSLAFRFRPVDGEKEMLGYRVLLFVNGWQYGRYYPSIASEDTFPVPAGVLDYSGENVIGMAVWALQETGARVDVEVVVRYAMDSSLDLRFDGSYLRPGWDPVRLEYA